MSIWFDREYYLLIFNILIGSYPKIKSITLELLPPLELVRLIIKIWVRSINKQFLEGSYNSRIYGNHIKAAISKYSDFCAFFLQLSSSNWETLRQKTIQWNESSILKTSYYKLGSSCMELFNFRQTCIVLIVIWRNSWLIKNSWCLFWISLKFVFYAKFRCHSGLVWRTFSTTKSS